MCSLQTLATFSAMFSEYVELPFPRFYGFCLYDDFEHVSPKTKEICNCFTYVYMSFTTLPVIGRLSAAFSTISFGVSLYR